MIEYDRGTALLIVDVQNDFADPGGSLYVRGGEEVVEPINREIERARAAGALVLYTQDWHPAVTPHFAKDGGIWPVHCVQDSWGAAFHPALILTGEAIRKGSGGGDGYSGFSVRDPRSGDARDTRLEAALREHSIEKVVIAGLATDYCVRETALDAVRRGFETTVLTAAVRAVDLESGDGGRALEELRTAGVRLA